jgi:hypothetical protein
MTPRRPMAEALEISFRLPPGPRREGVRVDWPRVEKALLEERTPRKLPVVSWFPR